jgi:hypothetical protein
MRKIILIILFVAISTCLAYSQSKLNINYACSYYGEKTPTTVYTFSSDNEALSALKLIADASGLSTNFKLVAADVPNAAAVIFNNNRYILYNQTFMYNISQRINYWASISILAHEVGHHLNGHSLIPSGSRPSLELEADKFSGFVLAKLGASLAEAQSAINALVSETGSSTHPGRTARLAAIANGWYSSSSSTNKVSSSLSNVAKRPKSIFLGKIPGKDDEKEDLFIKKYDKYGFNIISENGYIFSNNEFKKISITDDVQVYWFPFYIAYGYVDNYTEIPIGQYKQIEYGSSSFSMTNYNKPNEYIYSTGNYLIVYYPSGGFNIIANGMTVDNPSYVRELSFWQKYPSNVKNSTGLNDNYYYVYQINDGVKDVLIEVSDNDLKMAQSQNKFIVGKAFEYKGGPIIF